MPEIEHLVLFRFNDQTTAAQRQAMFEGLRSLKSKIPEIVELSVGENLTNRGKGYSCGLRVRLRSTKKMKADTEQSPEMVSGSLDPLDVYQNHPDHQHVLQTLIKPIVADVLAIDYLA